MFVVLDPRLESLSTHELTPPQGHGWYRRAAAYSPGDDVADMRLGTVQEIGNIGERQKTKIIEAIHKFV
jgi:hypothetical protein